MSLTLELVPQFPPEVPVGAGMRFKARISDAAGSDLRGGVVTVSAGANPLAMRAVAEHHDGINETADFSITAPDRLDEFTWLLRFAPGQQAATEAECVLPVTFRTTPVVTSLAVWDVPSPVAAGSRFAIKVGAKSAGSCSLGGAEIAVMDERGAILGRGKLSASPWPDTDALHWAEIALTAPMETKPASWRVTFTAPALALPHADSGAGFSFAVVAPPAHRLSVTVVDDEESPVEDVMVALGPYRAATDAAGSAQIDVPAGRYTFAISKPTYEAAPTSIEIGADTKVRVAMKRLPEEVKVWG